MYDSEAEASDPVGEAPQGPPPIPKHRRKQPPKEVLERRETPRVFHEMEVSFESEHNFYTGFTEDVSEGGLFLATYQLQPMGTEIEVEFTLPDETVIEVVGIVRWIRDPREENPDVMPGMGLQFKEISDEAREAINVFISMRSPLFWDD